MTNSRRRNGAVEIWNNILCVRNGAYLYGRATALAMLQSNIMSCQQTDWEWLSCQSLNFTSSPLELWQVKSSTPNALLKKIYIVPLQHRVLVLPHCIQYIIFSKWRLVHKDNRMNCSSEKVWKLKKYTILRDCHNLNNIAVRKKNFNI